MAPPWLDIYTRDTERRHGFQAGLEEYERLRRELPALGYDVVLLPKVAPSARAEFVVNA
jgi:predicted ATPase